MTYRVMEGRSAAECDVFTGDSIDHAVTWGGDPDAAACPKASDSGTVYSDVHSTPPPAVLPARRAALLVSNHEFARLIRLGKRPGWLGQWQRRPFDGGRRIATPEGCEATTGSRPVQSASMPDRAHGPRVERLEQGVGPLRSHRYPNAVGPLRIDANRRALLGVHEHLDDAVVDKDSQLDGLLPCAARLVAGPVARHAPCTAIEGATVARSESREHTHG